jgi:hypothetical protein
VAITRVIGVTAISCPASGVVMSGLIGSCGGAELRAGVGAAGFPPHARVRRASADSQRGERVGTGEL